MDNFTKADLEEYASYYDIEVSGTKAEVIEQLKEAGVDAGEVQAFLDDLAEASAEGDVVHDSGAVDPALPPAPKFEPKQHVQRSPLPTPTEPERGGLSPVEAAAVGIELEDEDEE